MEMNHAYRPLYKVLAGLFVAAMYAFPQATISAQPGTLNYVEGHAYVDGQEVQQEQLGHLNLQAGQSLRTDDNSKAEVLLTPGVFLRVGDNSEVKMVTPSLTNTQVAVTQGEALVEVAQLYKENNIQILNGPGTAKLEKKGLYQFEAGENPRIAVLDGKASVYNESGQVNLGKGREVAVTSGKLRSEKFNTKDVEKQDELYAWSNLRSAYAAEASYASAKNIIVDAGSGYGWGGGYGYAPNWYGTGWYWNPGFSTWAFIPGGGYFYNPFGWGFFSPRYVYQAPIYYLPGSSRPIPVNPSNPPRVPLTPAATPHGVPTPGTRPVAPGVAASPRAEPPRAIPQNRPPRTVMPRSRLAAPRPQMVPRVGPRPAPRPAAPPARGTVRPR
jgi:hypothetical protein